MLIKFKMGTFQSSLPRGERHLVITVFFVVVVISIHAPARGATETADIVRSRRPNFNPRSREGSDDLRHGCLLNLPISIHAPARGATCLEVLLLLPLKFQSTLPRGERRSSGRTDRGSDGFQSTLPRGERLGNK